VGEDGFDHALALGVELAAEVGGEQAPHERVKAAVPARAGALALAGVGRDQHPDSAVDQAVHLGLMPIAGVGDHHVRPRGDARGREVGLGRGDHRFEVPEVG
jgi:hypothetical protein